MDIKTKLRNIKNISQRFGSDLKITTTLTLKKSACVGMCILELSKVPIYEFHYGYIKTKCGKKLILLSTGTDNLVYEIETKMFLAIVVKIKKCLILVTFVININITMIQTYSKFQKSLKRKMNPIHLFGAASEPL